MPVAVCRSGIEEGMEIKGPVGYSKGRLKEEKSKNFFGRKLVTVEGRVGHPSKDTMAQRWKALSHTSQLAPALLQTMDGLVANLITHREGAAAGARAAAGEHATEGRRAGSIIVDHVTGAATTNMVDRSHTTQFAFQFLVEAEHSTLTTAVDVSSTATTGLEGARDTRVQASQRRRTGGITGIGGLCVLQADDIASTAASCMDGRPGGMRDGGMRFNDVVIRGGRHYERCLL